MHITKIKRELFFALLNSLSRTKTLKVSSSGINPVMAATSITKLSLYGPTPFDIKINQIEVGRTHNSQSQSNQVSYLLAKTQATDESSMIKITE
ncbi:MAG: hypothetical protein L3J26_12125 [Candidatus Polarisedimenticolaceae bacterium]|nr:hypothetical protein [Candidatus Polarisedimenticolaceae bacterium]